MPASMISAPPGGSEKVSGNNRLIVASGCCPGSSPTSIPTTQPIAQNMRLFRLKACSKPNSRFWMIWRWSMRRPSVERQLNAEQLLHRDRDETEADHDDVGTRDRKVLARV